MTRIENAGRFDVIIKIRRKKWNIITHENSALRAAVTKGCIEIKLISIISNDVPFLSSDTVALPSQI